MDEVVDAVGGDHPVVVRSRIPGGRCWYDLSVFEWFIEYYQETWFDPKGYYFNEPIDPRTVTLNAEITRAFGVLELFYATEPMHMRPALREHGRHARGLKALMIMRHCACEKGRETIEDLLELYPDHVIEFTCMSRPYGTLGWRTVIWEVRNY
jgi:hypothetical protein